RRGVRASAGRAGARRSRDLRGPGSSVRLYAARCTGTRWLAAILWRVRPGAVRREVRVRELGDARGAGRLILDAARQGRPAELELGDRGASGGRPEESPAGSHSRGWTGWRAGLRIGAVARQRLDHRTSRRIRERTPLSRPSRALDQQGTGET